MAVEAWQVTAGANVALVFVYTFIAATMITAMVKGRQMRSNPVLSATAAIFATCALGHGVHVLHAVWPMLDLEANAHDVVMARTMLADPVLLVWDVFTVGVAVWYWTLRSRFAIIYQGAALCEDMAARQEEARLLHDSVVQGLVEAKLALDMGDREHGEQAVRDSLEKAKTIISGLMGEPGERPLRQRAPR